MKKPSILFLVVVLVLSLLGCSNQEGSSTNTPTYKVGICNYVDDASLNQIVANIQSTLENAQNEHGITFEILYENANADSNLLNQIVTNFIVEDVDLMIGIATPVAMTMQAQTEDTDIPVVFAAVSDPLGAKLVASLENPGGNLTGTSDFLDTKAIINLMTIINPELKKVGLLYDAGQDSSTLPIQEAEELLTSQGIEVIKKTGTNVDEIRLATQALIQEGVEAVFTPSDNTVMTAELSIYEDLMNAGIPHYAGADSFALNGAFLGYGVDYANLGKETGNMVVDLFVNQKDVASYPVMTFDNGIATINEEVAEAFQYELEDLTALLSPYCTNVQTIQTAEEFE